MLRRLIVNADDFGLTRGVSAGILGAARHGIVTSTTLLVTARLPDEELAALHDSGLGVGVHVNLTLGRALTGRSSLTDADGSFVRDARVAAARATARARARSAGLRTPDHFFGESGPDAYWSPARTLIRLRALPVGVSEFMTHPGLLDPALAYSRYGRQRETELAGVGTPAARAAVAALGITLCHFGDL